MQLPPLNKEMLAKMGVAPSAIPISSANLGVKIPNTGKRKLPPPRDISADECIRMFGTQEAVEMNFIPQMLTALALEQAEEYINYCRDNKLTEYKKHNREMRRCIDEYNKMLRDSYRMAWYAYRRYYDRLRETVNTDLFKAWCTFTNEAARQYVGMVHKEIPARICFISMLLNFVDVYDSNMDKLIANRLDMPIRRTIDPQLMLMQVLCIDIAESYGFKMAITDTMSLCVKVLAERCRKVVKDIITEEEPQACKQ
ncbi:MAG: hypothetical protein HDS83_03500 [Bacteroidales bacterium]|nr:hypothetical protein [Bacteroidales bacterium]